MMRIVALALQLTGSDGQVSPPPFSVIQHCPRDASGDDVTVCGRSNPYRYRLEPLPPRFEAKDGLPAAEVKLGGGTLSAEAGQGAVGNTPTNRAMLKWKLAF